MLYGKEFLHDFNERFDEFRKIELEAIKGKGTNNFSEKSFSLLQEIELCYASGAYVACIILTCMAIEASIRNHLNSKDRLVELIKRSGYKDEIEWLRNLRKSLVHDVDNIEIIDLCFADVEVINKTEEQLKDYCKKHLH